MPGLRVGRAVIYHITLLFSVGYTKGSDNIAEIHQKARENTGRGDTHGNGRALC
jgi:hypothetical protein